MFKGIIAFLPVVLFTATIHAEGPTMEHLETIEFRKSYELGRLYDYIDQTEEQIVSLTDTIDFFEDSESEEFVDELNGMIKELDRWMDFYEERINYWEDYEGHGWDDNYGLDDDE